MKTTKRLMALLIALLVLAANVSVAMAAGGDGSVYTGGVSGSSAFSIKEKLYLENSDAIISEGEYIEYTLSFADGANPLPVPQNGAGTIDEKRYSGAPRITTDKVKFTSSSAIVGTSTKDYSRYMEGNFIIDFSGLTFYEPGIYRYNLTKTKEVHKAADNSAINDSDVTNRRENDYILLYVASDNNTATLQDVVYVHANSTETINGKQIGKEFVDRFKTHHNDLSISKAVAGSMGSKSEYFQFTISLTNGPKTKTDSSEGGGGTAEKYQYKVTTSQFDHNTEITTFNADSYDNYALLGLKETLKVDDNNQPVLDESGQQIVEYKIELDENGTWTGTVWLRHGQGFVIDNLPAGMIYTVTEDSKDYTSNQPNDKVTGVIPNSENDTVADTMVYANFINTKDTPEVPTGINLQTTVPMLGILLASLLLAVVFCGKRRESR